MIEKIRIENFKNFEEFEFDGFKRVNLIAGKNNVGKTNLLEAIFHAQHQMGPLGLIYFHCLRSNLPISPDGVNFDPGFGNGLLGESISGLFWKDQIEHKIKLVTNIGLIEAYHANFEIKLINGDKGASDIQLITTNEFDRKNPKIAFEVRIDGTYYYSRFHGYPFNPADIYWKRPSPFISHKDQEVPNLEKYYNKILLDQKQAKFKQLSKEVLGFEILDIRLIKSQDSVAEKYFIQNSSGQYVLLGELGFGTNRMLKILLILLSSSSEMVFIDEVDLGIHYSIQEKFWSMIFEVSKALEVQIFATTHSRDCFEAFAKVSKKFKGEGKFIRLQEFKGKIEAVDYDEKEMMGAYESDYEVR